MANLRELPLVLRVEAERDLADARDWYEAQRDGLGQEFRIAVNDVFDFIREFPESHPAEYRGVRKAVLRRFPYVAYYRILDGRVEVLAVLHGRRHSREWRARL